MPYGQVGKDPRVKTEFEKVFLRNLSSEAATAYFTTDPERSNYRDSRFYKLLAGAHELLVNGALTDHVYKGCSSPSIAGQATRSWRTPEGGRLGNLAATVIQTIAIVSTKKDVRTALGEELAGDDKLEDIVAYKWAPLDCPPPLTIALNGTYSLTKIGDLYPPLWLSDCLPQRGTWQFAAFE